MRHRTPHAHAGRGIAHADLVSDVGARDAEILEAIAEQEAWIVETLADLVRAPTTLGNEEAGQQVIEGALGDIGLEPVDVLMDAEQLRAHPSAAPFDWDVEGKRNVVAVWEPNGASGGAPGGR